MSLGARLRRVEARAAEESARRERPIPVEEMVAALRRLKDGDLDRVEIRPGIVLTREVLDKARRGPEEDGQALGTGHTVTRGEAASSFKV